VLVPRPGTRRLWWCRHWRRAWTPRGWATEVQAAAQTRRRRARASKSLLSGLLARGRP